MSQKSLNDLLNEQVNKEFFSAYLYLDMSCYFKLRNLDGFAHWYEVQAREEQDHAMRFLRYMLDNGMQVSLAPIAKPDKEYGCEVDVLDAALTHEEYITASINAINLEAHRQSDFRTMQFLDWFIKEQEEEECTARTMLARYENFCGNCVGRYLLDQEMGARK